MHSSTLTSVLCYALIVKEQLEKSREIIKKLSEDKKSLSTKLTETTQTLEEIKTSHEQVTISIDGI